MKISFVIPLYNAEKTIAKTLDSLNKVEYDDFEIVVVDDCSTDSSPDIVNQFNCKLIRTNNKSGAARARNIGLENAEGDIIFFIDSDIVIKPHYASSVSETFKQDEGVVAIVGILSKENPYSNFSSQYKNLHMHFYMKNMPELITSIYTSVTAVRKETFKEIGFFDSKTCRVCSASVEDIDLGQRISDAGYKILLNPDLQVIHLKKFSLPDLIRNDFKRAIDWSLLFFQKGGIKRSLTDGIFAYLPITAILGTMISPLVLLSLIIFFVSMNFLFLGLTLFFCVLFLIFNMSFLGFLRKERGGIFFYRAAIFLFLDSLVAITGAFIGLFLTIFSRDGDN